mmetsp:Transcript_20112/g.55999  ORF Transcript_20112/g.55999 Transcript_20112/m.55999 type:complete len:93 (-) Transcript_20112:1908-2186(-)
MANLTSQGLEHLHNLAMHKESQQNLAGLAAVRSARGVRATQTSLQFAVRKKKECCPSQASPTVAARITQILPACIAEPICFENAGNTAQQLF